MANFKIEDSEDLLADDIHLFQTPPTQSSITSVNYVDIRPVNPLIDGSPVEFVIPNNSSQYVDLKGTKLHVKAKVTREDGSNLVIDLDDSNDNVAPVTGWLHAMWEHVETKLNQQNISSSVQYYPYKAHIKALLNFPPEVHDSRLKTNFFYTDRPGFLNAPYMDDGNTVNGNNRGLNERYLEVAGSSVVEMQGRLFEDIMDCERLIPNMIEIKIKLFPSKHGFQLISSENDAKYKVKLLDAYLRVPMKTLSPSILTTYEETLKTKNAIFPFEENQIKAYTIPAGQQAFSVDDAFQGSVPTRLICFMVKSAAVNGSYNMNPFNYNHFNKVFFLMFLISSCGFNICSTNLKNVSSSVTAT